MLFVFVDLYYLINNINLKTPMQKIPIRQLSQAQQIQPIAERFKICHIEHIIGEKDLVHDLHRHDFFFILSLKNGQGNHEVDFVSHIVRDHSMFFL